MNQDNYIALIYKRLKGVISPEESTQLNNWVKENEDHHRLQQQIEENWAVSKDILPPINIDAKKDFQSFKKRMQQHKMAQNNPEKEEKEAVIRTLRSSRRNWLAIAAALALPLLAAIWLFLPNNSPSMVVAQTATDEIKEIQLADGTLITLNENSTLQYPTAFNEAKRVVELTGEAFFDVESNPNRPFEVHTEKASITVLGTEFNVRSNPQEDFVSVNVEEGKVRFSSTLIGKAVVLKEKEVGTFDLKANELKKNTIDNNNASAWRTKSLIYRNTPLKLMLLDLKRHFKVQVDVTNPAMLNCPVTARFRNANPKSVLDYIVQIRQMELKKLDSNVYELSGGVCE